MSGLSDRIKRDIEAVASIYPTVFCLYDEPLARLTARIENTVADEIDRLQAIVDAALAWRQLALDPYTADYAPPARNTLCDLLAEYEYESAAEPRKP